ncbi:MAG: M56 family metallopeptidase [Cyanobacteria bacterium J06607_13]
MMHSQMIVLAVLLACCVRAWSPSVLSTVKPWSSRWAGTLSAFVIPPLFLLMTAVSVVTMGPVCQLRWEGWLSFSLAAGFVVGAWICWGYLIWLLRRVSRSMDRYPLSQIRTPSRVTLGRIIDMDAIFSAQVGFWSSDLVVSRGVVDALNKQQLEAVLAHEAGHAHYRDTFWFFWLGGLRRLTCWLPHTDELWEELLLLREMRADRWAARTVDRLVLAESLISFLSAPASMDESICAGFSLATPCSRLAQRIDALLVEDTHEPLTDPFWEKYWLAIALALTPLLTIPFHH